MAEKVQGGPAVVRDYRSALAAGASVPPSVEVKYGKLYGMPAVLISEEDMLHLAKPFELTLIGKFSVDRPSISSIRNFVVRMKFFGFVRVDHHDMRNVVFRFSDERDYMRVFARRIFNVHGTDMRVTKWSPFSDVTEELPIMPLWVAFPGIRYQYFHLDTLMKIAKVFGNPLCVDKNTATQGALSQARVLVEVDVSVEHPRVIWVGDKGKGGPQEVIIEELPLFCHGCKKMGHLVKGCRVGGNLAQSNLLKWVPKALVAGMVVDGCPGGSPGACSDPPAPPPGANLSNYVNLADIVNGSLAETSGGDSCLISPNLHGGLPGSDTSSIRVLSGGVDGRDLPSLGLEKTPFPPEKSLICKESNCEVSRVVDEPAVLELIVDSIPERLKVLVVEKVHPVVPVDSASGGVDSPTHLPPESPSATLGNSSFAVGEEAPAEVGKGRVVLPDGASSPSPVRAGMFSGVDGDGRSLDDHDPGFSLINGKGKPVLFSNVLRIGSKVSSPISPRRTRQQTKLDALGGEDDAWSLSSKGFGRGNGPRAVALDALLHPKGL